MLSAPSNPPRSPPKPSSLPESRRIVSMLVTKKLNSGSSSVLVVSVCEVVSSPVLESLPADDESPVWSCELLSPVDVSGEVSSCPEPDSEFAVSSAELPASVEADESCPPELVSSLPFEDALEEESVLFLESTALLLQARVPKNKEVIRICRVIVVGVSGFLHER